jgi:type IV pilus assembly protein PilN
VIRINLLPHREEKRKARRQQFYAVSGLIAVLAGLIVVMVHGVISGYISQQESKNDFLKKEIAALDKDINEIKRLKEQTDALLSRKRVIESLQTNRAEAVRLFNELARQVPAGVYLKTVKQSGAKVNIQGYAQSNARVSTLMRNLEASPLLEAPNLLEIKATTVGNRRLAEFNLDVQITRAAQEDGEKPTGKQDKKA